MGSDHAPHVELDGALAATRDFGVGILVGHRCLLAFGVENSQTYCRIDEHRQGRGEGKRSDERSVSPVAAVEHELRRQRRRSRHLCGMVDVIVTDGFTGNVMLKLSGIDLKR